MPNTIDNGSMLQRLNQAQGGVNGGLVGDVGSVHNATEMQRDMSPIDILIKSGAAISATDRNSEVSINSLKKSEIDKIMAAYKRCKAVADSYYNDTIEPVLTEREAEYIASEEYYRKRFPVLSETSKFCSRDIKTTVDTLIPSYMEVFVGSDDPVDVKGVNADDDEKATKIQQLLKYQLQRKNAYVPFMMSILKDSLVLNYGVAKVYWNKQEKRERYHMMIQQGNVDLLTMIYREVQNGKIEIVSSEPLKDAPDLRELIFDKVTVTANHPVVCYMPPSELRFTPDSSELQDCKFKAHRKVVTGDYLKRKEIEGVYSNIDKAISEFGGNTEPSDYDSDHNSELETINRRIKDDDNASKEIELYEAYIQVDYNNDGIYEDLIVHAVGDNPIRISINELGIAPFFINQSDKSFHSVFNDKEGLCDNLIQQQDLKTAIFRQCIVNVAKNNTPRTFIDMRKVNADDLIDGAEFIRVDGDVAGTVFIPPQLPLNQMAQTILQYSQNEIESQSGSTRYNQGLDSNSLNRTATGITAIMGASEKRTKNTARLMVETFLTPMMKYIILLNQKYLGDTEVIRLTNESVSIKKDELDIDYDLIINVGEGAGTREARIQYLMLLTQQILPIIEQRGLVDKDTWFEVSKDLFEQMGIRNVTNYIVDPNSDKAKQIEQAQSQAQQQLKQEQLALLQAKAELELAKAKAPRLSVQYDDLPLDAKQQLLEASGIKADPKLLQQQEIINNA